MQSFPNASRLVNPGDDKVSAIQQTMPKARLVGPDIGKRLRELRARRGESLQSVADRAGLSRAFLSQIERGVSSPSVTSVTKLAQSLGVSLSALFLSDMDWDEGYVSAGERERVTYGEGHVDELLSPSLSGRMLVLWCRVEPNAEGSWGETYVHEPGEECLVLLGGRLEVAIEADSVVELEPGDTLTFASHRPHRWRNRGPVIATGVWVLVRRGT